MIVEGLIDLIFKFASGAFELLPEISWDVNSSAWQYGLDILSMIAYLLPWGTITTIVSIIIGISIFRLVLALIKSFLDFIPFF